MYLAPTATWDIDHGTRLTLIGQWTQEWNELVPAQTASGYILDNVNGKLPHNLSVENPTSPPQIDQKHYSIGYEFTHQFSPGLTLTQNLRQTWTKVHWSNIYQALALGADERTLSLYDYDLRQAKHAFAVDTRLAAQLTTGAVSHRLTGGFEYLRQWNRQTDYRGGLAAPIQLDLFDPDYSVFQRPEMVGFPAARSATIMHFIYRKS